MTKNSCTPINPKKYSCNGLKNIHTRNLITKKNSCGSKILPPHNFSDGPSLSLYVLFSQQGSPGELDPLSFHKLCVDMHVNKTKFERNNSLEYYHMTFIQWENKTCKLKKSSDVNINMTARKLQNNSKEIQPVGNMNRQK